ncbi:MAG: tetratricopeptide repeat protein [Acidobacteriota bacterium]|nr:MAG: tetratricopeptide repeat protein [Acidobacteriota bacterium]
MNLESKDGSAAVGFYTTSSHPEATVLLKAGDQILLEEKISIDPGRPYTNSVTVPSGVDGHDLRASISVGGRELVAYSPIRLEPFDLPEPVKTPPQPSEIPTNEELYLTGLWIEQFHNADLDPDPYWEEALRRDPGDVRVNTAMGIRYFKKARYSEAEGLLRKALERLTSRYQVPKDAEAIYYLGATLKAQGRNDEAFKTLYKSTWSAEWRDAGYYLLAEIATQSGDLHEALALVNRSVAANAANIRALNLKAALLRHLGQNDEARQLLMAKAHHTDPLDVRSMAELWLLSRSDVDLEMLTLQMREHPATGLETAAEYLSSGLWKDGSTILSQMVDAAPDKETVNPLAYYYLAYFSERMGDSDKAREYRTLALQMPADYVFPFQSEVEVVLRSAMDANPSDARAPYYLGNLLFDWQPEEAVRLWEHSAELDPTFPIVHRNLAIAWSHRETGNSLERAISSLERAVALAEKYPIHFFELDQLYQAAGVKPEKRLELLEANHSVVEKRDDALAREIGLKVTLGKYDEAIELMTGREFEVWEGGELNVADLWTEAHLLRGRLYANSGKYQEALADYRDAAEIPANLPSERRGLEGSNAELGYWSGLAHEALGETDQARKAWEEASQVEPPRGRREGGAFQLAGAIQRYYSALALQKLGKQSESEGIFGELTELADDILKDSTNTVDPGASFREQLNQRHRLSMAHCLAGLAKLGLQMQEAAEQSLRRDLEVSPDNDRARTVLDSLEGTR